MNKFLNELLLNVATFERIDDIERLQIIEFVLSKVREKINIIGNETDYSGIRRQYCPLTIEKILKELE